MYLLQEAKAIGDFIDAVVSILPWINVDTLLPALNHTQFKLCIFEQINSFTL